MVWFHFDLPDMAGPFVLAVEDSDADFAVVEMALQSCLGTFGLHRVLDGEQAIRFLQRLETSLDQPRPNLVLLDVNLPGLNGFEVLQAMKSQTGIGNIPVVVFTSSRDPREKKKALALGAEEFITKPVNFDQLMQALEEVCVKYLVKGDHAGVSVD